MTEARTVLDDPARLAALHAYEILDTEPEPGFDRLTELAARICRAPIAIINLVESRRQWFKSEIGLGVRETSIDVSICRHLLLQPGLTVINDTRLDTRLCHNPLVTAQPGLRFYAGCLLQTKEGYGLGTLCVLDREPRDLDANQRFALETLAEQVVAQLDLRLTLRQKSRLLDRQALLLDELNHRVRNNLQVMRSVIGLQTSAVADPAAKAALRDTASRIRSIAAVHERLQRVDDIDVVDLEAFLGGLAHDLKDSLPPGVEIVLQAEPLRVPLKIAVPLALIANELVTNAIKHAYPDEDGGVITIRLEPAPADRHRIIVQDRGRGLPAGFDLRASRSLGTRIVGALAQHIDAEVQVERATPGTSVSITFPARDATAAP